MGKRRMEICKALAVTALIALSFPIVSHAKKRPTLLLMTGDSPPFMSEKMREQGAAVYALRKVFAKLGYDLEVRFAPWTRAKLTAEKDTSIDGFFPYAAKDVENFIYSEPFSEAPWVIIQRKDKPVHWNKLEDLTKYTAGNVIGIELRPGIRELVESGKLKVENTTTDSYNILKLATKRVDMLFMNPVVFQYVMNTDRQLAEFKGKLEVNPKVIYMDKYGLALRKTPHNAEIIQKLNKANTTAEVARYMEAYIKQLPYESHPTAGP